MAVQSIIDSSTTVAPTPSTTTTATAATVADIVGYSKWI
jgi:hypothetical protein